MKRYQFHEYGGPLRPADIATPALGDHEVLLTVEACGVCHSDVHVWEGYFDLGHGRKLDVSASRTLPFTLGHEIAGRVAAIGDSVTGVEVGERVVAFPWIGCGDCNFCAHDREHLCLQSRALGTHVDGGFADQVVVPHERYLFGYGDRHATLAATYGCSGLAAFSALLKVKEFVQRHIVIIGAGGVGLAALRIAAALYNAHCIVVDIDEAKLEAATALGATHTVNGSHKSSVRELRTLTGGGCTAVMDFVGSEASATQGFRLVAKSGILVVVGLFGGSLQVPLPLLSLKDLTIRGSDLGSLAEMRDFMELVRSNRIDPIPIEIRPLDQAQKTLEDLLAGAVVGRVVLAP